MPNGSGLTALPPLPCSTCVRAAGHDLDPGPGRCFAAHWACRRRPGERARFTADGIGPVDGIVYFVNAHAIGVRTQDALYRFLRGFGKPVIAAHHLFAEDADPARAQLAWESWLRRILRLTGRTPR